MKKYAIRFHYAHDIDIISIYENYEFDLTKAIYCSLTAFCNGEIFAIKMPQKREKPFKYPRRILFKRLILDEKRDEKAIKLIERINKGYRNNFLKNLLRLYLSIPLSDQFVDSESDKEVLTEMFMLFRYGRKEVDAASFVDAKKQHKDVSRVSVNYKTNEIKKEENISKEPINSNMDHTHIKTEIPEEVDEISPKDDDELTNLFSDMLKH